MKCTKLSLTLCFIFLLCSIVFFACRKDEGTNPPPGAGTTSADADLIAARLLFLNSTRKQGDPPAATSNNSLKISFKDTFYLVDEVLKPIKFLHLDKTKDMAGAFIHVSLSGASSFYYEAPELKQMSESDTVSVIMIGIDPSNLNPPLIGELKIIPYDKNKQPIAQFVRPLKVAKDEEITLPNNDCGLELPVGQMWRWVGSYLLPEIIGAEDTLKFYSEPNKVHSPEGQDITGACCNGVSVYPNGCPGDPTGIFDRKLHFATYYQINYEYFRFFNSGNFKRETSEDSPIPFPAGSNFCAGGNGLVMENLKQISYDGTWTITPAQIPPGAPGWLKNDKQQLNLKGVSSTGTGFGNPGGVIHILDCKSGDLVLVQLDRGGGGMNLIKVYEVEKLGDPLWHN